MRITFWGVRGSCPIFPSAHEVREYTRRVAVHSITTAVEDLVRRSQDGQISLQELVSKLKTPAAFESYQRRLGLPELPVYGGETTCVQIDTSEGNTILIDGGSGIRHCAKHLVRNWQPGRERDLYLLGTHEHLDHRSGIPFSRFCFSRPETFTLHIYGTYQFLAALDERYGVFSRTIRPTTYMDDPIDYRMMTCTWKACEVRDPDDSDPQIYGLPTPWDVRGIDQPIAIGTTRITACSVYHGPTRCLAYKVIHNGKSFVFCTDHELRHGLESDPRQRKSVEAEERLVALAMDADVAYFDGQYYLDEYLGRRGIGSSPAVSRIDWGHGCIEDCVARAKRCRVKRALIGHHDPEREWPQQVEMDRELVKETQGWGTTVELAKGDMVVEV